MSDSWDGKLTFEKITSCAQMLIAVMSAFWPVSISVYGFLPKLKTHLYVTLQNLFLILMAFNETRRHIQEIVASCQKQVRLQNQ
jgi:hypothetical protein